LKHDPAHAKALTALIRRLKKKYEPQEPMPVAATAQLLISFLQWESTTRKAERAFEAIMGEVVDLNELRICFPPQIIAMIGAGYPLAESRIGRMRETLNEVFRREHDWQLKSLESKNKKEQRAYLETLPGVPPYVISHMMLVGYGGHAMPVDEKLVALLAGENCCDLDAAPEEVESFLMRQIRADDALDTHLVFQAWSDASRKPTGSPQKTIAASKTTRKTISSKKKK